MEIKIFGRSLFEAKRAKANVIWDQVASVKQETKYLPDFHTMGSGRSTNSDLLSEYVIMESVTTGGAVAVPVGKGKNAKATKPKREYKITPKGVYKMELLNDKSFKLNTNEKYVDQQLADFKDKLSLISAEEYDMRRGVDEIASIVLRLENRKKYPLVHEYFEQFPYTSGSKISNVLKTHGHLQLGQVAQFVADMPKEAVDVMKAYNEKTKEVCGKQAVYYIVADKKDFKKSDTRRDPILLAQSPFGHFWQILGAWDEEMMFLEEL